MKYIVLFLISFGSLILNQRVQSIEHRPDSFAQQQAFEVLNQKCNVCHSIQNPSKVFTHDNMNGYVQKIHRQVFVWKRMPKGKEIKLTEKERNTLKNWINEQKNK